MDLFETLKQFKQIKPDSRFTEESRRMILASPQVEPFRMRVALRHMFEAAGSLALAGILVFVIADGFAGSKFFSPVSFSGIDPTALHAEADAIDMQINLTNLSYTETAESGASTPALTTGLRTMSVTTQPVTTNATSTVGVAASTTPSSTPSSTPTSINQALQQLSQ